MRSICEANFVLSKFNSLICEINAKFVVYIILLHVLNMYLLFLILLGFFIPQRVLLSIMGFLAITNAYTMRICLNVAITEMVKKNVKENVDESDFCPDKDNIGGSGAGGTFAWDENLQGIILSSFFWGYVRSR